MVGAYLGVKPRTETHKEASEEDLDNLDGVPVNRLSKDEFEALLRQKGIQ